MDAILFLISAQNVSMGRFSSFAEALIKYAPKPAKAIRLELQGRGLWSALDDLKASGATSIELHPVGLPFSQSLETWLPGAAGTWLSRQETGSIQLFLASPLQFDTATIHAAANAERKLTPIPAKADGHLGKGWDAPPAFKHHILVCNGPRCHLYDAPNLAVALKHEIGVAGLSSDCLITTTGCLYPCNKGPVLVHYPAGHWYRIPDLEALRLFVGEALCRLRPPSSLLVHTSGRPHDAEPLPART